MKKYIAVIAAALLIITAASCTAQNNISNGSEQSAISETAASENETAAKTESESEKASDSDTDSDDVFTDRDLEQTADLTDAGEYTVKSGENISITSEGVYVLSGEATDATVTVDAGDNDKVQLVLDGVSITNDSAPAIYVKNADKVFITTAADSSNSLSVTGSFTSDGDTNTDAVIFSKDDLVLNGKGTLKIASSDNGVTSKDDLKITGGTLDITSSADALEANDSIAVADGNITVKSEKDALHAENDEDNSVGSIYIRGGSFSIDAASDGIQGTTTVQIDGGELDISASEGIEATCVKLNGGTVKISASDDGINAAAKSTALDVVVEINGGDITIDMGQGDTDGVDSNGDIYVNGGTIRVNGQSTFDYDGKAEKNGGTIIINGEETDTISNQMMGNHGGGPGGMGGGRF